MNSRNADDESLSSEIELESRAKILQEMMDGKDLDRRIRTQMDDYLAGIGLTKDLIHKAVSMKNIASEIGHLARRARDAKKRAMLRKKVSRAKK